MSSNKPGSLRRHARAVVMKIIGIQVLIGLLLAIGLLFFKGWDEAYSVLTGVLIGVLPSYYLGSRMFGGNHVTSGDLLLKQIYVAQMMKLGFTIALFLITILFIDAKSLMVLCGYTAVVAVNWLAMKFSDLGETSSPPVAEAN